MVKLGGERKAVKRREELGRWEIDWKEIERQLGEGTVGIKWKGRHELGKQEKDRKEIERQL